MCGLCCSMTTKSDKFDGAMQDARARRAVRFGEPLPRAGMAPSRSTGDPPICAAAPGSGRRPSTGGGCSARARCFDRLLASRRVASHRLTEHCWLRQIGICRDRRGEARRMATGEARIVLVGVGGLGSASALALARGGVGELVLVDPDRVEPSNLARQVIYRMDDLGRPKAEAAAERLGASFPGLRLQQRPEPFTAENASRLLGGAAMVVDGLDSFASRTVLSDAAQAAGIPMVHAGVLRFGGQAMTILPGRSTCYRCLMPEPPPPDVAPDPAEEGVLGPVVGLFGALQAREALLLLAGQQPCLVDRLWVADLLGGTSQLLRLVRDGRCPGCGPGRQPWCAVDEAERRDVVQPAPRRRRAAPGGAPARSRGAGERRESGLTPEATGRYQRQLRLREVGEAGQRR
ncbi:MAG: HesA/MoeB/ThiF family protein, partial [Deltaproteobacteria bacterium]|nr:HesA/MoeB/ThiF family protein [Deltaproteobacteria bacterium]